MEVPDVALGKHLTRVRIGSVGLHPACCVGAAVPDQDHSVITTRRLVHQGAKLAVIKPLVPDDESGNLAHLYRGSLCGVRLNFEDIDSVGNTRTIRVTEIDTVAGDT